MGLFNKKVAKLMMKQVRAGVCDSDTSLLTETSARSAHLL